MAGRCLPFSSGCKKGVVLTVLVWVQAKSFRVQQTFSLKGPALPYFRHICHGKPRRKSAVRIRSERSGRNLHDYLSSGSATQSLHPTDEGI